MKKKNLIFFVHNRVKRFANPAIFIYFDRWSSQPNYCNTWYGVIIATKNALVWLDKSCKYCSKKRLSYFNSSWNKTLDNHTVKIKYFLGRKGEHFCNELHILNTYFWLDRLFCKKETKHFFTICTCRDSFCLLFSNRSKEV